jgi:hypothetical protein
MFVLLDRAAPGCSLKLPEIQVSLVPPPCDELTTSEPSFSATRVRPPGTICTVLPDSTRAQVDVARRDAAFHKGGAARQAQRGLGDVAAGVGQHGLAEVLDLGLGGSRAHQHAVAAGAVHLLDHQVLEVGQHVLQVVGVAAHVGGHVVQDGLFAQVELDHLGHVGVDRLVVGHPGAHGVADGHIAGAVGAPSGRRSPGWSRAEHLGSRKSSSTRR